MRKMALIFGVGMVIGILVIALTPTAQVQLPGPFMIPVWESPWNYMGFTNRVVDQHIRYLDVYKIFVLASSRAQTLSTAGSRIEVLSPMMPVGEDQGGTLTLNSTPTVPDGIEGQILILVGSSDGGLVLTDEAGLSGSNLQLDAATRTLGRNDILVLLYMNGVNPRGQPPTDAASAWYEVSFATP